MTVLRLLLCVVDVIFCFNMLTDYTYKPFKLSKEVLAVLSIPICDGASTIVVCSECNICV